ncbi:hypothetical protein [Nitrosomonas communis]|uniref:Uncharacterized protein n=1 Tax=Nitrosomonas communis TaxID=44574 RepID=A0A1I4P0P5_9PROT|nr:hypothetical protein [Nitrosomonas communis]SFM21404.1 hypothetical protein SAMN05421863_101756 [Nitrosomonas communis]
MKKKCLPAIFALYMASPLIMANDQQPITELTSAQMDYVTAGTQVNADAAAAAQAAGIIAASFASTLTLAGATSESGGVAAAGASGTSVGTDAATTGAGVQTSANGTLPSQTFGGSNNFDGPISSHSAAVEITVIPTLPTFGPN